MKIRIEFEVPDTDYCVRYSMIKVLQERCNFLNDDGVCRIFGLMTMVEDVCGSRKKLFECSDNKESK